eukprot:15484246-Alexandrium_andersonii.AAC.1
MARVVQTAGMAQVASHRTPHRASLSRTLCSCRRSCVSQPRWEKHITNDVLPSAEPVPKKGNPPT